MNEKSHGLPRARIERSYFSLVLWCFPVAAAGICVWFLMRDFVFAGPTITIYFDNADGLREQNSIVKYRGVKIGEIKSLKLTKDQQRIAVTAKLDRSAADVARQGSSFWIVRPEIKLGAVSGLRTIVSGNYVTVKPGNGQRTNTFAGLESAPIEPIPSLHLTLLSSDLGSLQKQSQIFYRGIQVGEVLDFRLGDDARHVVIDVRIQKPYAPLVRANSVFWNAGGINVHVGLFSGAQISAESAQTVISGGIAFATPPDYTAPATNGTVFVLNQKEDDDWKKWGPDISLRSVPDAEKAQSHLPQFNAH